MPILRHEDFVRDGLLFLKSAVRRETVLAASEHVANAWSREIEAGLAQQDVDSWTARTFLPSMRSAPVLMKLFEAKKIQSACEMLLGASNVRQPSTCQIAIRLGSGRYPGVVQPTKPWHCDGIFCSHHSCGVVNTFELLVGVALGEVAVGSGGPEFALGGHMRMAKFFEGGASEVLMEGEEVPASAITGSPLHLTAQPGDAVIAHGLLPHRVSRNETSFDRAIVYFRIGSLSAKGRTPSDLCDPWNHMQGTRDFLNGRASR